MAPYQYLPLDAEGSRGDIRLVELLPTPNNDSNINNVISCRLHTVLFHDLPAYEALSYHWGDPNITLPIILDGKSFQVTKNLAEALQCLTVTDDSRFLWVDAICINQTDDAERSQQVRSMAKIYEDARRVLVWLGLGEPDTLAEFQRLTREDEYKRHCMQSLELRRNLRTSPPVRETPKNLTEELLDSESEADSIEDELPVLRPPTMGLVEPTETEMSAIDKIFRHPWWERVWVIQEATVARELCVICGRQALPWNMLCQIYPAKTTKPGQLARSPYEQNLEPLERINNLRKHWKAVKSDLGLAPRMSLRHFQLDFLVSTFRTSKSTDPRDKIYALLGLAIDKGGVILDYSISTVHLYLGWTVTMLNSKDRNGNPVRNGVLKFLDYCWPTYLPGLPSWVPDWTVSSGNLQVLEQPLSFGKLPHLSLGMISQASGKYFSWKGSIQSKQEPYTLNIWGITADRITGIGNFMPLSRAFLDPLFLAYEAVSTTASNEGRTTIGGFNKPIIGRNRFLELSENLARLEVAFKAAARAENLDDNLQAFLNKLFYACSRERDMGLTQYEINTDTVNNINMRALLSYLNHLSYSSDRYSSRRFFTTERGRFGFGRTDIQEGDLVSVLAGGANPYILREEGDHYIFVGNCFCQDLMLGEAVEAVEESSVKWEEFVLH